MNPTNLLLLINVLEASMRAGSEIAVVIGRAQAEGRDVTDAEIDALRLDNDSLSAELLTRLRAQP